MNNKQQGPILPKVSIFDKRKQSFRPGNINIGTNQNKVNLPQFRISQHKGS